MKYLTTVKGLEYMTKNITHWMPLPEPPENKD